jgi:hypothetical protein
VAADAVAASSPEGEAPAQDEQPAPAAAPAAAELAGEAKAKAKSAKPPKAGKGGKAEKGAKKSKKSDPGGDAAADGPSVAAHPRAARAVSRAKGWGGLLGFVVAGYLSLPSNTIAAAGLRALIAGVVCYVVVWAGAVFVWRRLVMLELKGREQQLVAARTPKARPGLPAGAPQGERLDARSPS